MLTFRNFKKKNRKALKSRQLEKNRQKKENNDFFANVSPITPCFWLCFPLFFWISEFFYSAAGWCSRNPCGQKAGRFASVLLSPLRAGAPCQFRLLLDYILFQNYDITAAYFWTTNFGRRNVKITSQKLSWNYFLGAVILQGIWVIVRSLSYRNFWRIGLPGELMSGAVM